jgi:hypothetical protein
LSQHICEYIIYFAPKNFHPQFKRKEEWINQLQYNPNPIKNKKNSMQKSDNQTSLLGTKLQEALKKK